MRKRYHVKCPDGSRRMVHRDLDDAFPLVVQDRHANVSAELSALDPYSIGLSSERAQELTGVLYSLDELNQSMMFSFRGVYATYQADPCSNSPFLQREVRRLIARHDELTEIRLKVHALCRLAIENPTSERVVEILHEVLSRLGGDRAASVTHHEIAAARDEAKGWTQR